MKTQIQLARGGRYLPLSFLSFLRLAIGSRSSILASFCGVPVEKPAACCGSSTSVVCAVLLGSCGIWVGTFSQF